MQMKDFKQTAKMKAEGSHYCGGGKVKKYAAGGSIDDDVRARAMKWIESGSPEQSTGETPKPKKAAKLPMPDYSNEDLDKMDAEAANYERKRESRALLNRKSAPKFSATRAVGVRDIPTVPDYAKEATGYKRGGKVKRGNKK